MTDQLPRPLDETEVLEELAAKPTVDVLHSEPQSHSQALHTISLNIQSSCKRSHQALVNSADRHSSAVAAKILLHLECLTDLDIAIPRADDAMANFAAFAKAPGADPISRISRRRRDALLLYRNCERIVDVMALPNLLGAATASTTSSAPLVWTASGGNGPSATALDLNAHIARLHNMYPESDVVSSVSTEAHAIMHTLTSTMIANLKLKGLKLAAALRLVSFLKRVLPELSPLSAISAPASDREQCLSSLFFACRLSAFRAMISDLEPLRELAGRDAAFGSAGSHAERYMKRYIEIFREQSFGVLSMLRNMFPNVLPVAPARRREADEALGPICLPSSIVLLHLVEALEKSVASHLGILNNQPLIGGLITQVMYCAASLGRLGGDFSVLVACLRPLSVLGFQWAQIVKKHRGLTNKMELIAQAPQDTRKHRSKYVGRAVEG